MKTLKEFKNMTQKQRVVFLVVSSVIGFLFIADKTFLHGQLLAILWFFDILAFSLFVIAVMFIAGFAVMKSLLVVVAGGLSLLIFLGQEYCHASQHTPASDSALKGLVIFGIAYVMYAFGVSLYEEIIFYLGRLEKDRWSWEKILFILLMLSFAYMFVWMVYLVVSPIIFDLCVF